MSCKEEFIDIFKSTITREGADKLLDFLECERTRNIYREIAALLFSCRIRKFVYDSEQYLMLRRSVNMPVCIFENCFEEKLKRQ